MTRLGYGIISYFSLIKVFLFVFGLITVINIPVMINFAKWNAFE